MKPLNKNKMEAKSIIKPPLGLIPKKIYDEQVKVKRFNEVCRAISDYYQARLKINIEWVEEYNELVAAKEEFNY